MLLGFLSGIINCAIIMYNVMYSECDMMIPHVISLSSLYIIHTYSILY